MLNKDKIDLFILNIKGDEVYDEDISSFLSTIEFDEEDIYYLYDQLKKENKKVSHLKEDVIPDSLNSYFKEISKYPLLTKEEDQNLRKRIKEGDKDALDYLVSCNLRLVTKVASDFKAISSSYGINYLDLIQEGNLGLIRAASKFDFEKDVKFSTYATIWIKNFITRYIHNKGKLISIPVKVSEEISKVNSVYSRLVVDLDREPTIEEIHEKLPSFSLDKIRDLLSYNFNVVSLDKKIGREEDNTLYDFIADKDNKDLFDKYSQEDISKALNTLDENTREIVVRYFGLDGNSPTSLGSIAREKNKSRQWISQVLKKGITKLKEFFGVKND